MKKILLTLGSIAALATPIIAVVSCGPKIDSKEAQDNTTTQTGSGNTNPGDTGAVISNDIYSAYNMRSIYDMKSEDKTKLTSLIVEANKEKTFDDFKALVAAESMDAANEKMVNDIMEHYKNAESKVTVGWHVLHFALATTDDTQLKMAAMGWKPIDGDEDLSKAQAAVKAYILNGTIDTREMAKSIIDKFAGREGDKFSNATVQGALVLDEAAHKFTVTPFMGTMALQAMGGRETLKAVLDHGTGQTWTIEDAPAANPAG